MKSLMVFALVCSLAATLAPGQAHADSVSHFTPQADLRVRQEVMDGLLPFAPDADRNQVRFRSRLGGTLDVDQYRFRFLLTNEHRRYVRPDGIDFDWDEVIVDQLYYQLRHQDWRLSVGRQNIIWDEGFFMLEGHPLDGSRSIYHDAVYFQRQDLDLALIYNTRTDPLVLAGDMDRPLRDSDELALAVRVGGDHAAAKLIVKRLMPGDDQDGWGPERTLYTVGYRFDMGCKTNLWWLMEAGAQYNEPDGHERGQASHALHTRLERPLGPDTRFHVGGFYYGKAYTSPFGRWPLWSELYIYTLVPEGGVANWRNIAAPFAGVTHQICPRMKLKARAYYLMAPDGTGANESDWESRGLLTQLRLDVNMNKHLRGHLTWEMLDPGTFHDAEHHPFPMEDVVHFLRWEMILAL